MNKNWDKIAEEYVKEKNQGLVEKDYHSVLFVEDNYVVIKEAGGAYWSGMSGDSYCPASYHIYDLSKKNSLGSPFQIHEEVGGRWSKKRVEVFKGIILGNKRIYNG